MTRRYNLTNLANIPDEYLDSAQLKIKQNYQEAIHDGRNNVSSSIKELAVLKNEHNLWRQSEVVVVKRGTSQDISEASNLTNKRQR